MTAEHTHAEIEPLLASLEPQIAQLLERHKAVSSRIDWSYHEYLPLEAFYAGRRSRPLSAPAYTAVETALLIEANLPWYTAVLYDGLKTSLAPIQEFIHLWTAEEDQHSTLLETYLLITDNGEHAERAAMRRAVLTGGWSHELQSPLEAMVYTSVQELATQAFYVHTARACEGDDLDLAQALRRVAKDETRHYAFYRDVVKAHLDVDPDYIMPISNVITKFRMPGRVIPDFKERSAYLAAQHVFGPEQFYQDVIEVACSFWGVDSLAPVSAEAQTALSRLSRYRAVLKRVAGRGLTPSS